MANFIDFIGSKVKFDPPLELGPAPDAGRKGAKSVKANSLKAGGNRGKNMGKSVVGGDDDDDAKFLGAKIFGEPMRCWDVAISEKLIQSLFL